MIYPKFLNFGSVLYSYDIESSYTYIQIDLGMEAIDCWVTGKRDLIPE